MTSEVLYQGELRTTCTHLASGNTFITDAPTDNHGKGEAFSPTDLVATALATCMLTVMGIKANQKGINMDGAKATIHKIMGNNPRRISEVEITIYMPQHNYTDEEKSILEHTARTCPVAQSLHQDLVQTVVFAW
jgi:uncharacterized OsmC-like protein